MQKIYRHVLDKLIEKGMTDAELGVLLCVCRFQDDYGVVRGVYYKDVCEEAGICPQSFYNALRGLEGKGVIAVEKTHGSDLDVHVIGNEDQFALMKDLPKGERLELHARWLTDKKPSYVSLQHPLFDDKGFQGLKANEKLMAMLLLIYIGAGGKKTSRDGHQSYAKEVVFARFAALLRVEAGTVRRYFSSLRRFFAIGLKNGVYRIALRAFRGDGEWRTDNDLFVDQLLRTAWRRSLRKLSRHGCVISQKALVRENDLRVIVLQHKEKARKRIAACFLEAFEKCARSSGQASAPYVHKLLMAELNAIPVEQA